jgi:hypothetical protein
LRHYNRGLDNEFYNKGSLRKKGIGELLPSGIHDLAFGQHGAIISKNVTRGDINRVKEGFVRNLR